MKYNILSGVSDEEDVSDQISVDAKKMSWLNQIEIWFPNQAAAQN